MVTGERQRLVSCSTGHGQSLHSCLKAIIRMGILGLRTFQGPQRPSGDGTLCAVQACGIMVTGLCTFRYGMALHRSVHFRIMARLRRNRVYFGVTMIYEVT